MSPVDEWQATQERIASLESKLAEAIKTIQADHKFLAGQAGSPCMCEWCQEDEDA